MNDKYFELGSIERSYLGKKILENNYDYDDSAYKFDINLVNDAHSAIVRQIDDNATVLDVGCATGIIGSILKKYKNAIVDGIEYDKKATKIAKEKKVYRDIYNFSIVDDTSIEYNNFINEGRKYDYIIFADVLEHLINPYDVIVKLTKLLKKNGSFIISIPNISHIDVIKAIVNGNFNYAKQGVLDSTHLRFFSAKSFVDMIENIEMENNINYDIKFCERILIKPPYFIDDQDYKLFNLTGNLEDYLTLQNIFKLTPTKNKGKRELNFVDHNGYFDLMMAKFKELVLKTDSQERELIELRKRIKELEDKKWFKIFK